MIKIFGLPQPLTGNELVTILQEQNGQLAECSMPLSELSSIITFNFAAWISNLPTEKPDASGLPWNDSGVIAIS